MSRAQAIGLACALVLCARTAEAKDKRPRLMQLDLPADKAFEPNVLKVVNSFLAKDLRDQGFEVVTASDIATALGVEKQRQLLGCSESTCLAEIGGAMGVDYIVHGELAALERDTALTLTLNDTKGLAISEVADLVKGKEAQSLLEALSKDVPKLIQPLRESGKLSSKGLQSPTNTPLSASAPSTTTPPSHTKSFVALGVGGLCLVASGFTGAVAEVNNATLVGAVKTPNPAVTPANVGALRSTVRGEAWASTGLIAVGAIAIGVGAVWLLGGSNAPTPVALVSKPTALAWEF